ncbi:MAG: methionine ABC transporter ATP-binding protein [Pseudomonadota bacterium]|nr:methionine ABC transporter ATP-binding protein [Pseudomonadota bacterium]
MITLQHVSKSYRSGDHTVTALDDINLTIQPGKIFGVIGPSGAGKSTLIRCVNLLERPDQGKVIIDGEELTAKSPDALRLARKKIGMIFQSFNLISSANVFDNIALPLRLIGTSASKITQLVAPLLELTGLTDKSQTYPSQLSGGQKQRVAIARALVSQPHVLLSDEATSALDPETTHAILALLKHINSQLGVTILLITHEMHVVKETCHDLAIMEHGKIIEQADVIEFFGNPQTELAKRFIQKDAKTHLPEAIKARLTDTIAAHTNPLWHLSFLGASAQEPLIAHLMQKLGITLNILQANIELIRDQTMGTMVVEVEAHGDKLSEGLAFLRNKGVHVEEIGYVTQPT